MSRLTVFRLLKRPVVDSTLSTVSAQPISGNFLCHCGCIGLPLMMSVKLETVKKMKKSPFRSQRSTTNQQDSYYFDHL
jgi:hypothetical protein